ncbi:mechanosensitive ion channel family protein [Candidatus Latescibacterota bacterium]
MNEFFSFIETIISVERLTSLLRSGLILIVGLFLAKLVKMYITRIAAKRTSAQHTMIIGKISFYLIIIMFVLSALHELNFDLSIVLGAAGIVTVAVGFASQTSMSNIISGLFLLADSPFQIGDVVTVGNTGGIVIEVELLSVKLRTFQNGYVRIPNETIIKSEVLNHTHFPIRRIDNEIGVAYKEDISKVKDILYKVAENNPLCLEEPAPLFIFIGYGDSSLDMKFCVWTLKENFLTLMNSIKQEIKDAFDKEGIEIPFPHRTIYTGSVTEPFPVKIMSGG